MGHAVREDEALAQIIVPGADPTHDPIIISLLDDPNTTGRVICIEAPYAEPSVFDTSRIDAVCEALQAMKSR